MSLKKGNLEAISELASEAKRFNLRHWYGLTHERNLWTRTRRESCLRVRH